MIFHCVCVCYFGVMTYFKIIIGGDWAKKLRKKLSKLYKTEFTWLNGDTVQSAAAEIAAKLGGSGTSGPTSNDQAPSAELSTLRQKVKKLSAENKSQAAEISKLRLQLSTERRAWAKKEANTVGETFDDSDEEDDVMSVQRLFEENEQLKRELAVAKDNVRRYCISLMHKDFLAR